MAEGRLIVIEGLDGSGKATQAGRIAARLRGEGKEIVPLSFPCYDDDSSVLVRMYLSGMFGEKPGDVNAYAASMFYAADRYASFRQRWREDYLAGKILIADRYTTSNAVYQMSKLPEDEWDGYLDWLTDFEYQKLGIPAPDSVVLLDVPEMLSERLMLLRYGGDGDRMDIHERDRDYQKKSRDAALYCAKRQGWRIVGCSRDGEMKPPEEIEKEIYRRLDL